MTDCPQSQYHGNPFRYCGVKGCGWREEDLVVSRYGCHVTRDGWCKAHQQHTPEDGPCEVSS